MAELSTLERQLEGLREEMSWPSTPDLAARIASRLAEPMRPRRPWFQQRWAIAAAVAIAVLAALVAYTPSREAIANFLNLHTIITRVPTLPSPSPRPTGPIGVRLGLGSQVTLDEARHKVDWKVLVPSRLGEPDEVYLLQPPAGPVQGEVSLVYVSTPGVNTAGETGVAVLVTEARGSVNEQFFGKMTGQGTTVENVTVNGHRGWWVSGQPHVFYLTDSHGNIQMETLRLATNTLIIDEGGTIVRIEGNLTRAQALDIASTLA